LKSDLLAQNLEINCIHLSEATNYMCMDRNVLNKKSHTTTQLNNISIQI